MAASGAHANAAFGHLVRGDRRESVHGRPAQLLGLEHEYVVRGPRGIVDFRRLIDRLPLDGRKLDPGDRNAYRLGRGGVVTADGREAEIAIPPMVRQPGFARRIAAAAAFERLELEQILPRGHRLAGYSTHVSVAMPGQLALPASRLFLERFAPGLMLLADQADSPGLLVRPRPGRLELAVEYVRGEWLEAAVAYVAGAGVAIARTLRGDGRLADLPPALDPEAVVTADRYGWGIARDAFGGDLLLAGRSASFQIADGGLTTAQSHLEAAWAVAREALGRTADAADLDAADRLVSGVRPLRIEADASSYPVAEAAIAGDRTGVGPSPFGDILVGRNRPGFRVEAVFATWDLTVFAVQGPGRRAYASIPRPDLAPFLRQLDAGELDVVISSYLDSVPTGTRLESWRAALEPALFDGLGAPAALVAPEIGVSGVAGERAGKSRVPTTTIVDSSGRRVRVSARFLFALLILAPLIAVSLVGGFKLTGSGTIPTAGASSGSASTQTTTTASGNPTTGLTLNNGAPETGTAVLTNAAGGCTGFSSGATSAAYLDAANGKMSLGIFAAGSQPMIGTVASDGTFSDATADGSAKAEGKVAPTGLTGTLTVTRAGCTETIQFAIAFGSSGGGGGGVAVTPRPSFVQPTFVAIIIDHNSISFGSAAIDFCHKPYVITFGYRIVGIGPDTPVVVVETGPETPSGPQTYHMDGGKEFTVKYDDPGGPGVWSSTIETINGAPPPFPAGAHQSTSINC